MLPMNLMTRVVASQKERSPPIFRSQDQMIQEAEKYITQREQRLEKIESAVKDQLAQQVDMAYGKLENSHEEISKEAPFSAAVPQLENLKKSLTSIKRINREASQALEKTTQQLITAKEQQKTLSVTVQRLENKVRASKQHQNSETMAFLQDFKQRAAICTVNPNDSRLQPRERKLY